MNTEIAKVALDIFKLLPRYLVAVATFTAVLLFGSQSLLQTFGLDKFTNDYRQWIGIAFLVSTVILICDWGKQVFGVVRNRMRMKKLHEMRLKRLQSVTEDEKQILRYYIAKQTRANMLRIDDGVVQGLVAAGIITRSSNMGSAVEGFAHNIAEWAWNYLNEHVELLAGSTNFYRTDARLDDWQD